MHWTSVALLLTAVIYGSASAGAPAAPEKIASVSTHASFALLLLAVMLMRVVWRISNPNPVRSYQLAQWHIRSVIRFHWLIYVLVIAQCVIGVGQLVTTVETVKVFGIDFATDGSAASAALNAQLNAVHAIIYELILVVIFVHVSGALYHQVFGVVEAERENDPRPGD